MLTPSNSNFRFSPFQAYSSTVTRHLLPFCSLKLLILIIVFMWLTKNAFWAVRRSFLGGNGMMFSGQGGPMPTALPQELTNTGRGQTSSSPKGSRGKNLAFEHLILKYWLCFSSGRK